MSRLGKRPIAIPEKTEVSAQGGVISVKGPKGELSRPFKPVVAISADSRAVTVSPLSQSREARAFWGTYSSHIKNMIKGVNEPFVKRLVMEGVGFKWEVKGDELVMSLGFSHPVTVRIPQGVKAEIEKNTMTVSGIDKEEVGSFAALVRSKKKPEPYKGKGIRYEDEIIHRKEGKKTA